MKISTLVGLTNTKLAGETLTYAQLRPLYDEVVVDINTALNACFPLFSVYAPDYNNLEAEYDCFPDTYLVSVVALGAAYKFYTIDEEGIGAAQTFGMEYQVALFHMVRDYSSSVPTMFQNTGTQGYMPTANGGHWLYAAGDPLGFSMSRTASGCELGINPELRYQQGPQGLPGAKGDKGKTGNYYRLERIESKIYAVAYDSETNKPIGSPMVLIGDLAELKGEQGEKGAKGDPGNPGRNGYTPVRGVDYWTPEDLAMFQTYVNDRDNAVREELLAAISLIPKLSFKVYGGTFDALQTMPQEEISDTTIYLVDKTPNDNNIYAEYIYIDGYWEKLGDLDIDLSEYAKKEEVQAVETSVRTYTDNAVGGLEIKLTPTVTSIARDNIKLAHNTHTQITIPYYEPNERYELYIMPPLTESGITIPDVLECSLYILPCAGAPHIVDTSNIVSTWCGDDCDENGVFTPQANTHYEISFKRVGTDSDNNPIIIARVGAWQ